jgi:hypothetical protein
MSDLGNSFSWSSRDAARKLYVVEKRTADGRLDFSDPQPPFTEATEQQLCDEYFRDQPPSLGAASQGAIGAWYAERGWYFRPKTW